MSTTDNLDEVCWSARDLLAVMAAARKQREPIGAVIDKPLDLVGEGS